MGLTIVIKVGTSSLIQAEHNSLSLGNLAKLCEAIRDLKSRGDCISCCSMMVTKTALLSD